MTLPMDTDAITPLICQISRWSMRFVGREMSRLGFGPGQFFFLAELFRADGLSQDELSRRVGVDKSNTSRALARLEAYGLVRREGDSGNHRVKRVYLEAEAHKLKKTFSNIQHRWNAMLLNGFSARKKTEILAAMEAINKNAAKVFLEQGDIEPPVTDDQNELKWKRNGRSREVC